MNDLSEAPAALRKLSPIVFVNCAAGGNRTRRCLPQIQKLFASSRLGAEFVITQSVAELESCARAAIAAKHGLLIAMGGDGTFQGLVKASFGAEVLLGIVPSGGGNDLAVALGLPRDPFQAAKTLLQCQTRRIDLVKVQTANGRIRMYAGGGGLGLDSEAVVYAGGLYRRFPSRFRYLASALHSLARYRPLEVQVDFPGSALSSHRGKALLLAVLNTPSYGAGLRLAPEASLDDGLLNVVMIEELGKVRALALLPHLMGSGELRTPHAKCWTASRVRLTPNRPCQFQGDGEILGSAPVDIEVLAKAIQVLAPVSGRIRAVTSAS